MSVDHIERIQRMGGPGLQVGSIQKFGQVAMLIAHQLDRELHRNSDELDLGFFLHNSSCCPRGDRGAGAANVRPANHKPTTAQDFLRVTA